MRCVWLVLHCGFYSYYSIVLFLWAEKLLAKRSSVKVSLIIEVQWGHDGTVWRPVMVSVQREASWFNGSTRRSQMAQFCSQVTDNRPSSVWPDCQGFIKWHGLWVEYCIFVAQASPGMVELDSFSRMFCIIWYPRIPQKHVNKLVDQHKNKYPAAYHVAPVLQNVSWASSEHALMAFTNYLGSQSILM